MSSEQSIIKNFNDFATALLTAGFSIGGGNNEGIFSLIPWSWNEEPPYETPVRWHTGEPETDPWEWRMRVLNERSDIAYGKLFFKKSGYITREWYPFFLAVRRNGSSFEEEYESGTFSYMAKRIYQLIQAEGILPVHGMKALLGIAKEDKSQFDRALTELQMRLYITMCGRQQKLSLKGEEYGWSSTVFCRTEEFWGQPVFDEAAKLTQTAAWDCITARIMKLNPDAQVKKIGKFVKGI